MVFVLFKFTIVNDARPSGPLYAVISDGRKKSIQRCDVFDGSFKSIGAAWYLVVQGFYAFTNLKKVEIWLVVTNVLLTPRLPDNKI